MKFLKMFGCGKVMNRRGKILGTYRKTSTFTRTRSSLCPSALVAGFLVFTRSLHTVLCKFQVYNTMIQ